MQRETALTWSWLNILTKKRYDALQRVYGDLDTALQHLDEELLRGLSCKEDTIYKALNRYEEFDAEAYEAALQQRNIQFLHLEDDDYPATLRQIDDHPPFLYYRGDIRVAQQPCIALVGTRSMSNYGKRAAEFCTRFCVDGGAVTVSGLAAGIDTVVAQETLAAGGKTMAVLAHGMGQIYPQANKRLAEAIVDGGGAVLSEFPLDSRPDTYTFPARNRIVAGMSLATIVVEAPEGSGALITADLAGDYGRDVFAVPGQIFDENFRGNHRILHNGQAKVVSSAEATLKAIGLVAPKNQGTTPAFTPKNPNEQAVWGALTSMPQGVDDIMEKSGLEAGHINATLTMLELQGVVQNVGNNEWVRQ